jgi:Ni,Fe-hydrogenase I cytochrome b subunit
MDASLFFFYVVQWLFFTFLVLASKNRIKTFCWNVIIQFIYTAFFICCFFFMTSIQGEGKIIFIVGLVLSLLIHIISNIVLLTILLVQDWKKR